MIDSFKSQNITQESTRTSKSQTDCILALQHRNYVVWLNFSEKLLGSSGQKYANQDLLDQCQQESID